MKGYFLGNYIRLDAALEPPVPILNKLGVVGWMLDVWGELVGFWFS